METTKENIEYIYKKAEELGIEVPDYHKTRINNSSENHVMNMKKIDKLDKDKMKKYLDALWRIKNENAGGWNGWSGAHDIFKELGAKEKEMQRGHRVFVSLSF